MGNASLTEQIREEHLAVRRGIKEIQDELTRTNDGALDTAAVAEKLRALHGHLRGHFELEENEGPLSSSVTRTKRQEERANELLRQHPQFLERLKVIIERLSSAPSLEPGQASQTGVELRQLFADLGQHESMENILFQEQVYDEQGVGD